MKDTDSSFNFVNYLVWFTHEFLWTKVFSLKLLQQLPCIVDRTEIQGWTETEAKILKY